MSLLFFIAIKSIIKVSLNNSQKWDNKMGIILYNSNINKEGENCDELYGLSSIS